MFFKSKPLKRTCRALSTFFLILHWLENERDGTVCRSYYVDHSCGCTQKQNKTPWFSEVLSWKGGARDLHSLLRWLYTPLFNDAERKKNVISADPVLAVFN